VYAKEILHGPWAGWRLAGNVLISPDGLRITPEGLRGVMVREWSDSGAFAPPRRCAMQPLRDWASDPTHREDRMTEPIGFGKGSPLSGNVSAGSG